MKYLTYQLNKYNFGYKVEPLYIPEATMAEPVYIRLLAGNIKPTSVAVSLEGDAISDKLVLREAQKTLWEVKLDKKYLLTLKQDEPTYFTPKFYFTIDRGAYEAVGKPVKILGRSFGVEHDNEVSMLFDILNELNGKI